MQQRNWRNLAALVLLLAFVVPMLAACGGGNGGASEGAATEAPATGGEATEAPAAGSEATEAPAEPSGDVNTGGGTTAGGNAEAGVLRFNVGSEPATIDPQKASFVNQIQFIMMAYQPLMTFDLEMEPVPAAAESYEVSDDGLVYTFKLRADGKYSNGDPVTAENFVYAWQRLADPETAGEYQSLPCGIIAGYSEYSAATCNGEELDTVLAQDNLEELRSNLGVRAVDDLTLEIELAQPAPYFLSMAALWIGVPTREEDAAQGDDWWFDPANVVGNGPFTLAEWDHDNRAIWERNDNYVGPLGPVQLDRVEYYMINESQVSFQAYQNGELDLLGIASEDLDAVTSNPDLNKQVVEVPGSCTYYFGFNLNKPPFDEPQVRQAFAQAFDREAWNRDVFSGLGASTQSLIPPGFPGYQELADVYPFDPEAAKATLAEAGYENGEGLPEILLTYSSDARNNVRFEWVANQLRQNLGINATLDPVDSTAYSALFQDPSTTPQFFSLGWCADYPDPQNWISIFRTGGILNDRIGYENKEFDDLTLQADAEQDPDKRTEEYNEAERILLTDAPIVVTRNNGGPSLVQPYVTGIDPEVFTPLDYWPGFFNLPNITVEP